MENKDSNKYIVFHCNSIPTVDIAGTAVVKSIQKKYPDRKIIVVSNFPEIWLHNPSIYRIYKLGQAPYFYEDFITEKDTLIFAHDPTKHTDYVNKNSHIIESWCQMCGTTWAGPESDELPSLHFTVREEEVAMRMTQSDRPLFFIQPYEMFGSLSPTGWSWPKDIPFNVAGQIVHKLFLAGYAPVLIKGDGQKPIASAANLQMNLRQTLIAMKFSEKRLLVDSFMAAASAALGLTSTVTWLATNPKQNGYKINNNLVMDISTELKDKIDDYQPSLDIDNAMLQAPVDTSQAYDVEKIVSEIIK